MTDIEFGTFAVDQATRRVRGILVPWGEKSRTSASKTKPITFPRGSVTIPRDPAVVTLNVGHDRFSPLGRGALFEDQETGLHAEFEIADTEEGDQWLEDHGKFVKLSAEVRDIVRDANDHGRAKLTGAALVTEGAFASAALFAIDGDPDDENPSVELGTNDTAEAPADEEIEPDEEPDEEEEGDAVAEASASEVMLAGRTAAPKAEPLTRNALFGLVQKVGAGQGTQRDIEIVKAAFMQESGLFALDDITYNAAGDIAPLLPKQWLGEVVDGVVTEQKYVPLFGSQNLTSLYMTGWKWNLKPSGATWTGNKTEVPSTPASFTQVSDTATRWAGANDIAREHRDFGTPGFFEAYDRIMRQSFADWLDALVRTEALAAATDLEADNPASLTIGAGWSQLIDGALAITQAGLTPTGAVISNTLAKGMLKFPQSDILGYLSGALGLEGGSLNGFQFKFDGSITADHILVVARGAADVYTLPGSPVRAEALNIANGGVDVGFFGYGGFFVNNALGIVDVAPYTP
jgi:hypothetical protein